MRKHFRGWHAWLAALAFLAIVLVLNELQMSGGTAYTPENATWLIATEDFPAFYRDLLATDLFKSVDKEVPTLHADWQLTVRQTTGIRPTPKRWRAWLGHWMVASKTEDGWGACVEPGILLRVADTLRGIGRWRPAVRQYGPYFYAWRDGTLIFSRSEKYVASALKAQAADSFFPAKDGLDVWDTRPGGFYVHIMPSRQVYVSGWFNGVQIIDSKDPLSLSAWPADAAMAWAAAPEWSDLNGLASLFWNQLDSCTQFSANPGLKAIVELVRKTCARWPDKPLPENWDQQVGECAVALLGLDDSETLPVPEVGLVLRSRDGVGGTHPLEPLISSGALPYEWEGGTGSISTRAGEKAAICLATSGADWLAASQEPAMTKLIEAMEQPAVQCGVEESKALVAVNWGKTAAAAESLLRKAAKLELLPYINFDDVETTYMPLLRALEKQGNAHLHLWPSEGRLEFKGALTGGACQ